MNYPTVVIIAHADCWDGTAAAWVVERYCTEKRLPFKTFYAQYKRPIPFSYVDLAGRDVYVVDFSFSKDILDEMARYANQVVVLDHHHTAEQDLKDCTSCQCHFDMTRSGARMAWDYFYPNDPVPEFISRIEDRDLWLWQIPDNRDFMAGLLIFPKSPETIQDRYDNNDCFEVSLAGKYYRQILQKQVEFSLTKSFYLTIQGETVLCAPSIPLWVSELGDYLNTHSKTQMACVYTVTDTQVMLSFRSGGPDMTPIAKAYGGGGHKTACGCSMSLDTFQELLKTAARYTGS